MGSHELQDRDNSKTIQFTMRQFMSLGLLTATKKQVPSGHLHMRPIQWNIKANWHAPVSLEKPIPIPKSLYKHLQWWLQEENILIGQPLHSLQQAPLGDFTSNGLWSIPHNNLKSIFWNRRHSSGPEMLPVLLPQTTPWLLPT